MKPREMSNLGVPGSAMKQAISAVKAASKNGSKESVRMSLKLVLAQPEKWVDVDSFWQPLAKALVKHEPAYIEREVPAKFSIYGKDLDENAVEQMRNACTLEVAHRGALMPDCHLGYGLPIGGVLATENSVIPYAVGVDIACRMCLSVYDLPVDRMLRGERDRLIKALEESTRFGIGAQFDKPNNHDVMDQNWDITKVTAGNKDKAWRQLGSSGSGNHFVEYGVVEIVDTCEDLNNLTPGKYLALLSHSGSRGPGAATASHYSKIAMAKHDNLPKHLKHLSWLDINSEDGQEYWLAMNLMGDYASANHSVIHRTISKKLGAKTLLKIENHHNFCWREEHDGKDVYVHRKGATPAGQGVLGVIPGTMASSCFVVRGKGSSKSLRSSSHGAGRLMSRKAAKQKMTWSNIRQELEEKGVQLLSAGIDEAPGVYKDIYEVMAQQRDLVDVLCTFQPKIVKMAPGGPAED